MEAKNQNIISLDELPREQLIGKTGNTSAIPVPAHADTVSLSDWLVVGPVQSPCAAVDSVADWTATAAFLSSTPVPPEEFWPAEGSKLALAPGAENIFTPGGLTFTPPPAGTAGLAAAAGAMADGRPAVPCGLLRRAGVVAGADRLRGVRHGFPAQRPAGHVSRQRRGAVLRRFPVDQL
mgnify:CR=1 FL=1